MKSIVMNQTLYDYLLRSLREPDVLRALREEAATHPYGGMQIAPEQGQFMALLVELVGARNVLEIGVFTGYSSTRLALALPPEGRITACDINEEFTATARRHWQRAGVADKIDLRLGPALDTLDGLIAEGVAALTTWPSSMPTRRTTTGITSGRYNSCVRAGWS